MQKHRLLAPPATDVEKFDDHRRALLLSFSKQPDKLSTSPQEIELEDSLGKEVQKLNLGK